MKDIAALLRDSFAALKDAALVACVAAVLFFPEDSKAFLRSVGLTSIQTPLGTLDIAETQFEEGKAALTALDRVRREVQAGSAAAQAVDDAVRSVRATTVRSQEALAAARPAALASRGWMYMGTLDGQRSDWKPWVPGGSTPTVSVAFGELNAGKVVRVRSDVNLREARPSPIGELPQVVRIVRAGQEVRILDIDVSRPVEPPAPDAPGYRVWARVDVVQPDALTR